METDVRLEMAALADPAVDPEAVALRDGVDPVHAHGVAGPDHRRGIVWIPAILNGHGKADTASGQHLPKAFPPGFGQVMIQGMRSDGTWMTVSERRRGEMLHRTGSLNVLFMRPDGRLPRAYHREENRSRGFNITEMVI